MFPSDYLYNPLILIFEASSLGYLLLWIFIFQGIIKNITPVQGTPAFFTYLALLQS